VTGTLGGGALLGLGLNFNGIFSLLTLPALLAAGAMFFMGRHYRGATPPSAALPATPPV